MPRHKHGTPTVEQRILSALRVAARLGHGPKTVPTLHLAPGLTGRSSAEITAALRRLEAQGLVERRELGPEEQPWARDRTVWSLVHAPADSSSGDARASIVAPAEGRTRQHMGGSSSGETQGRSR